MGHGETAHYEQFLLFPQYFQRTCAADTLKPGFVWEKVKQKESDSVDSRRDCTFYTIHISNFFSRLQCVVSQNQFQPQETFCNSRSVTVSWTKTLKCVTIDPIKPHQIYKLTQ